MFRRLSVALAASMLFAGAAWADPIEGNWRTEAGSTAHISPCGGAFCIKLISGSHSGKQIGKMTASGANSYSGSITDPNNDKTYKGKASVSGGNLSLSGCVLGGLFCRAQNWKKL
ncbi:DUF2147 domain-containing protein [Mesorhizobium sp. KR9-304]|uniref:DUF2147 domain-containing protein n=1 Tax=Mesorhizobium sp. KR9-304 TaxID=3156614 RepID=UPI0032B54042